MNKDNYSICDECGSEFLKSTSKMMALCPECAHVLYGYPNCAHDLKMDDVYIVIGMGVKVNI